MGSATPGTKKRLRIDAMDVIFHGSKHHGSGVDYNKVYHGPGPRFVDRDHTR